MARIDGRLMNVYVDNTLLAMTNTCSLDVNQELPDATVKEDAGWKTHIRGLRDWTITFAGLHDPTGTLNASDLIALILNQTEVAIEFYAEIDGSVKYSGNASVPNVNLTADNGSPASFSSSFVGNGVLTPETVTV